MVRQKMALPYLTQKWYGNCDAVRTDGAAHEQWLYGNVLPSNVTVLVAWCRP